MGEAKNISIYGLFDGAIRYVGKTNRYPSQRLSHHLGAAKRGFRHPLYSWIRSLLAKGMRPVAVTLETVDPSQDWAARERAWIAHYRAIGARLFNYTEGGEGCSGHKFKGTERARKIAAALRTGDSFLCEHCGHTFYRKRSAINKGDCRFCSRKCYLVWQKGRSKPVSETATRRGIAAAAAKRKAQTHCKRGHPLSGDNLFFSSSGARCCKECRKIHKRTYRGKSCLDGVKNNSQTAFD